MIRLIGILLFLVISLPREARSETYNFFFEKTEDSDSDSDQKPKEPKFRRIRLLVGAAYHSSQIEKTEFSAQVNLSNSNPFSGTTVKEKSEGISPFLSGTIHPSRYLGVSIFISQIAGAELEITPMRIQEDFVEPSLAIGGSSSRQYNPLTLSALHAGLQLRFNIDPRFGAATGARITLGPGSDGFEYHHILLGAFFTL